MTSSAAPVRAAMLAAPASPTRRRRTGAGGDWILRRDDLRARGQVLSVNRDDPDRPAQAELATDFIQRVGMYRPTFNMLIDDGALTPVLVPATQIRPFVLGVREVGWTRDDIWKRFERENRAPEDFAGFERLGRVASALDRPVDEGFPAETCDAAVALLVREGLPVVLEEFLGIVRVEEPVGARLFAEAFERAGRPVRRFGHRKASVGVSVAAFRAALAPIAAMEDTILAEPDDVVDKVLDASIRAAVANIPDPRVRAMVGLFVVTKYGSVGHNYLVAVARSGLIAAQQLAGLDVGDEVVVDRTLRGFGFAEDGVFADSVYVRLLTLEHWITLSNLWQAFAQTHRHLRKALKAAMPAFPRLISHLGYDVKLRRRNLHKRMRRGRKSRVVPLAVRKNLTEAALEARMTQIDVHHAEYERRAKCMRKDSSIVEDRYEFEEDVVPLDGFPTGDRQIVTYRLVRASRLLEELLERCCPRDYYVLKQYRYLHVQGPWGQLFDPDEIVLVYEGVRPAAGAETCVEPAFVTLRAAGVLSAPGTLTAAKQAERAELIRRWNVPPACGILGNGLVGAEQGTGRIIGDWALRYDVVVLHLDQYRHGAMFGRLAGRLGLRCGVRSGETLQLAWQVSAFGFARVNGVVRIGFRAIPKGKDRRRLYVLDDRTFVAATDLVRLSLERWGLGKLARFVRRIRTCGPIEGVFVFQVPGAAMSCKRLNALYRLLMAGSPPSLLHDLRHVFAFVAKEDGVEHEDIADLLSHESKDLAAYYAAARERELVRYGVFLNKLKDERMALA